MAAIETMSRVMEENARRIIRARNEELPMGKQMTNLGGVLCVGGAERADEAGGAPA